LSEFSATSCDGLLPSFMVVVDLHLKAIDGLIRISRASTQTIYKSVHKYANFFLTYWLVHDSVYL